MKRESFCWHLFVRVHDSFQCNKNQHFSYKKAVKSWARNSYGMKLYVVSSQEVNEIFCTEWKNIITKHDIIFKTLA